MNIHNKFSEFVDYLNTLELKESDLYEQYAMMKNATKVLDERIEELQTLITEEMERMKLEKQQFAYGTFTITNRKTFKYSEVVKEKEVEVKALKKQEEESGVATFEEKKGLLFRG